MASINTEMLVWAREHSGIPVAVFAKKCGVTEERLHEWETGQHSMTFNQAMVYAEKAHVPFGYLFLDTPPQD
ncbi:helix-turn-helix domain-containing protein [Aeromonas hydrophila]|uniref:helix-turn-helix domain-containing protein n=1 Tax=Aeromonas hydrophila TaxID=644 RepID=UPI00191E2FD8|nr:helix-turn-helix transcriptional regulator [Aeromonas hydrophila]MBL0561411.1 helix-turn-helix transcriptional regulator [Aeromonas hydrophila]